MGAGENHTPEMALTLRATAAAPSMRAMVTELNALIPYVHAGPLATADSFSLGSGTFTPGDEGLHEGHTVGAVLTPRTSIVVRLGEIVRTIPTLQFPIGPDGHLRWFFRMPTQATQ